MGWLNGISRFGERKSETGSEPLRDLAEVPLSSFIAWIRLQDKTRFSSDSVITVAELYKQVLSSTEAIQQLGEKINERKARVERAEAQKEARETEMAQFRANPEVASLLQAKERRGQLVAQQRKNRDFLDDSFTALRIILDKKANSAFVNDLLQKYLHDPYNALLADANLEVISHLKLLQTAVENQRVSITLKEYDQVYPVLEKLDAATIRRLFKESQEIQKNLERTAGEMSRKDIIQKIEDIDYWLQHYQELARRLDEERLSFESERQRLINQRTVLCQELENELLSVLDKKIKVFC